MAETLDIALSYLGEKSRKASKRIAEPETSGHVKFRAPQVSSGAVGRLAEKLAVSEVVVLGVSDISERTFHRRKVHQEPLTEAESDRLLRIARVASEAERVFADKDKARRWLLADNRLWGVKPLDLLATDAGAREVELELVRIDFGDFA